MDPLLLFGFRRNWLFFSPDDEGSSSAGEPAEAIDALEPTAEPDAATGNDPGDESATDEPEVIETAPAPVDDGLVEHEDAYGRKHRIPAHTAQYLKYLEDTERAATATRQAPATETRTTPKADEPTDPEQAFLARMERIEKGQSNVERLLAIQEARTHQSENIKHFNSCMDELVKTEPVLRDNPKIAAKVRANIESKLTDRFRVNPTLYFDNKQLAGAIYSEAINGAQDYASVAGEQVRETAKAIHENKKKSLAPVSGQSARATAAKPDENDFDPKANSAKGLAVLKKFRASQK